MKKSLENGRGSIAKQLSYLLPNPAAFVWLPAFPKFLVEKKLSDIAEAYQRRWNWTVAWKCWLNPSSGKLEPQKKSEEEKMEVLIPKRKTTN